MRQTSTAFGYGLGSIMSKAAAHLANDRFAVVVMGEARYQTGPRKGHLYGLVPLTIAAMKQAGLAYYNDAILVNSAGSLPVRISAQFEGRQVRPQAGPPAPVRAGIRQGRPAHRRVVVQADPTRHQAPSSRRAY